MTIRPDPTDLFDSARTDLPFVRDAVIASAGGVTEPPPALPTGDAAESPGEPIAVAGVDPSASDTDAASVQHPGSTSAATTEPPVIDYQPWSPASASALEPAMRFEFAQASTAGTTSDASPPVRGVLDIPPYQLLAGGLVLGGLAGGGVGGGGGSGSSEYFVWGAGNLTITTPGGTVVTVDASTPGDGRVLTLIGASTVNVNDLRGSNLVDASALTGALTINIADDGVATSVSLTSGTGRTTVNSGDARDLLTIEASRLPAASVLVINGRASQVQVKALGADLDASLLASGDLAVTTSSGAPAPRTLSVRTGAGTAGVTGQLGDTIMIDAESLADNVGLRTSGGASYRISNLMGDLDNSATGSVIATLDHDPVPGAQLDARIKSSTAMTVANGAFDSNDTIILEGAGGFTVNGLVASLDASRATSPLAVLTGNSPPTQNRIAIVAGSATLSVNGSAADDTVAIDAALVPDGTAVQLTGASTFAVSRLQGDVLAHQALGNLIVSTPVEGTQSVAVRLGVAGGHVRASSDQDLIAVDALAMAGTSTLTIGGAAFDGGSTGAVTVDGLSGAVLNSGTGVLTVALAHAPGGGVTTASVTSGTAVTIDTSALTGLDTVRVNGAGSFTLNGVATNIDGTGIKGIGPVVATLGDSADPLNINLGTGSNDTVILNGKTTLARMTDVETLNVAKGGDISGASMTDAATAPTAGRITGTRIDFSDQTATLSISPAQHEDVRTALLTGQADSGVQTLQMTSGTKISQTIAFIDEYRLSAAGTDLNVTINGGPVPVRNEVQQQFSFGSGQTSAPQLIVGSGASDAVKTSTADLVRGGLTVDLASGGSDYVFVQNDSIGNRSFTGSNATEGFGGRVFKYGATETEYANFSSFAGTANHWKNVAVNADAQGYSAGIKPVAVSGFDSVDRVVYLEGTADVARGNFISLTSVLTSWAGSPPARNSVLEFRPNYPGAGDIGQDPKALDKIASLLTTLPAFNDSNGSPHYIVVYQPGSAVPDAWLYAAIATQNDGFDFIDNPTVDAPLVRDTDTLELIAIFKGVGVNAFTSSNFI